jgi:hypothetical protein
MANAELRAESASANPVRSINTDEFERAFIDMEMAIAMTDAAEMFIESTRRVDDDLCRETKHALVMLSQLSDLLQSIDGRMHAFLQEVAKVRVAVQ